MLLFSQLRVGQGSGLSPAVATFTGAVNSTTFAKADSAEGQTHAVLAQAWFQYQTHVNGQDDGAYYDHVNFTIGKIDPFVFFDTNAVADDESEAFVNNVFVHNPLLDSGGDVGADAYGFGPGVVAEYVWDALGSTSWSAQVGIFGAGEGSRMQNPIGEVFRQPFSIVQLRYQGALINQFAGAYQLYFWQNLRAENALSGVREGHQGIGASVSQQVAEFASVFCRMGYQTKGQVNVDSALTAGAVIGGSYWARPQDRAGFAVGGLYASDEYKQATPLATRVETNGEVFYSWQVNDHLQISPHVTYVHNPAALPQAQDVTAVGVRTKIGF